jgi:adenylylsulfate kinase
MTEEANSNKVTFRRPTLSEGPKTGAVGLEYGELAILLSIPFPGGFHNGSAGGMVLLWPSMDGRNGGGNPMKDVNRQDGDPAPRNITWHAGDVSADDRAGMLGQHGCVIWLTGLSGSGKSTIGHALEKRLFDSARLATVLDGDNVRHGLNSDLGFSPEDRDENIRRVGEVAALMARAGLVTIVTFISPYRDARNRARQAAGELPFFEVSVEAPFEECARRDPKGLYAKARAGQIKNFTGVDAPYEAPEQPELVLQTASQSVEECVEALVGMLTAAGAVTLEKDGS